MALLTKQSVAPCIKLFTLPIVELPDYTHQIGLNVPLTFWTFRLPCSIKSGMVDSMSKVIYTKYCKHGLYTVAHTFDCVCSKINNS